MVYLFTPKILKYITIKKNNLNHLYIHRNGLLSKDSYKGGYRPGIDLCISDIENCYFTFLIRGAVMKEKLVSGPNNVLNAILEATNSTKEEIEKYLCEIKNHDKFQYNVYYKVLK